MSCCINSRTVIGYQAAVRALSRLHLWQYMCLLKLAVKKFNANWQAAYSLYTLSWERISVSVFFSRSQNTGAGALQVDLPAPMAALKCWSALPLLKYSAHFLPSFFLFANLSPSTTAGCKLGVCLVNLPAFIIYLFLPAYTKIAPANMRTRRSHIIRFGAFALFYALFSLGR